MSRTLLSFALLTVLALRGDGAEPSLKDVLQPLADAHKGDIAIAVKSLDTGEEFYLNADTPMPTASLIKLAVMVETYRQADAKTVDLGKMLTLTKDDRVPGSGILRVHFSDGASFSLRDAVRLMMAFSDNTATNMVLDQVGIQKVCDSMAKLGFPNTRVNAKVYKGSTSSIDPARTKKFGLGSTTARESIRLLEMIQNGTAASKESCEAMLNHLKACDDKEKFPRFLPPGTVLAHKTGSVNSSKTDAGILFVPDSKDKKKLHPVLMCVLTDNNEDQRWVKDNAAQVTIAKIGRAVYDHFAK